MKMAGSVITEFLRNCISAFPKTISWMLVSGDRSLPEAFPCLVPVREALSRTNRMRAAFAAFCRLTIMAINWILNSSVDLVTWIRVFMKRWVFPETPYRCEAIPKIRLPACLTNWICSISWTMDSGWILLLVPIFIRWNRSKKLHFRAMPNRVFKAMLLPPSIKTGAKDGNLHLKPKRILFLMATQFLYFSQEVSTIFYLITDYIWRWFLPQTQNFLPWMIYIISPGETSVLSLKEAEIRSLVHITNL